MLREENGTPKTYAQVFTGVRQDSGDPKNYVKILRSFYDGEGITDKKVIVFSDSLDIDKCLEYKKVSELAGFQPTFGVGTFLSNDFVNLKDGKKSTPLNIVIKLSSADGRSAIKIRYTKVLNDSQVVVLTASQRQHWQKYRRQGLGRASKTRASLR